MTDEIIIGLFTARSETAIAETQRLYGRYFYSIAHGIVWNDSDAEEVVNDTYLHAWNTIPPAHPDSLRAFLGRVTRQLAIKRLEHNTAKKRGEGQYLSVIDELAECLSGDSGDEIPDQIALREVMNRFLHTLPPDVRGVFIRRYWHMQSIEEIALSCRKSESRVKSQLMRTRKKLKTYLMEEGFSI